MILLASKMTTCYYKADTEVPLTEMCLKKQQSLYTPPRPSSKGTEAWSSEWEQKET